jgi:hypothetical protein
MRASLAAAAVRLASGPVVLRDFVPGDVAGAHRMVESAMLALGGVRAPSSDTPSTPTFGARAAVLAMEPRDHPVMPSRAAT